MRSIFKAATVIVLCQFILFARTLQAQHRDSTSIDSLHHTAFAQTTTEPVEPVMHGRVIDLAIGGGIGYYSRDRNFPWQADLDFSGRTEDLNLIAGFHYGFSTAATEGLLIGLRFPLIERQMMRRGLYGDLALLFFDEGIDSGAFHTGVRAALTGRFSPIELRAAAEIRQTPIESRKFEGWVGLEGAVFFNIVSQQGFAPTRKDTLRAAYRYIATTDQLNELDEASSYSDIDDWLDKFWRSRNIVGVPAGSARREFERRIALANARFGTPRTLGVGTDMGRVMLVYGEPDEVQIGQSPVDPLRKYELWIDRDRIRGYAVATFLFLQSAGTEHSYDRREGREIYSNIPGEPSETIPYDVPTTMRDFLRASGQ